MVMLAPAGRVKPLVRVKVPAPKVKVVPGTAAAMAASICASGVPAGMVHVGGVAPLQLTAGVPESGVGVVPLLQAPSASAPADRRTTEALRSMPCLQWNGPTREPCVC